MGEEEGIITGNGLTVTVEVAVPVQPFKSVPKIEYAMVDVGSAITVAPDVELRFVFGLQV